MMEVTARATDFRCFHVNDHPKNEKKIGSEEAGRFSCEST